MVLHTHDFIQFETNSGSHQAGTSKKVLLNPNETNADLINESSNTNYSIEEDEDDPEANNTSSSELRIYVAKLIAFWKDELTDKLMIAVRYFYKPEQLKSEINNSQNVRPEFLSKELISTNQYDVVELTSIRAKCSIMNMDSYKE